MSRETPGELGEVSYVRLKWGGQVEEMPTFGALVGVDGIYENALGRGMGHVAQDAEDVHVHDCGLIDMPRGGSRVSARGDDREWSTVMMGLRPNKGLQAPANVNAMGLRSSEDPCSAVQCR